jgi:hypothetical protein
MRKKFFSLGWVVVCALSCQGFAIAQGDEEIEDPASQVQPPNPLTIPQGYRYDPAGRRDPFVNPVQPEIEIPTVPDVRPPGLPGVLLNEAGLNAIVRSPDPESSVVVIAAPGERVFIAHTGDELYDVVIREIRDRDVVFEVKPLEGDDPLAPRPLVARALTQENE